MTVFNHTTKEKCEVKYHSYSYFTRERQRKVCATSIVSSLSFPPSLSFRLQVIVLIKMESPGTL